MVSQCSRLLWLLLLAAISVGASPADAGTGWWFLIYKPIVSERPISGHAYPDAECRNEYGPCDEGWRAVELAGPFRDEWLCEAFRVLTVERVQTSRLCIGPEWPWSQHTAHRQAPPAYSTGVQVEFAGPRPGDVRTAW